MCVTATLGAPACTGQQEASYRGGQITVKVCPVGPHAVNEPLSTSCGGGCFLGLTVRMANGEQIDLPAIPVGANNVTAPLEIGGQVGPDAIEYQVALWRAKRQPCQSKKGQAPRHGCKAYGYELLEPLWGPEELFDIGGQLTSFEPLPGKEPHHIEVLDAGGGSKAVQVARGALSKLYIQQRAPEIKVGAAQGTRDFVEVLYRASWHRILALRMVEELKRAGVGVRWRVRQWPEATSAFVVAVGGP